MKIKAGKKTFRTITTDHVLHALTYYLRSLTMIEKDEEVTHIFKVPEGFDIKIEKSPHGDAEKVKLDD